MAAAVALPPPNTIYCHERWKSVEERIAKLKNKIEGKPEADFSVDDYTMLYSTVYNMIFQKPFHHYSPQLYDAFREIINEYLKSEVLPWLTNKEFTLEELVLRCSKYKQMARWLANCFRALERSFIPTPLQEVAIISFQQLIYKEIKGKIKYALTATIKKTQKEDQIDTFLKEVLDTFDQIKLYDNGIEVDFEYILLKVTKQYCEESQKWKSYTDYITKAEEYLRNEPNLIGDQLLQSSFKEIQYLLFTKQYPEQVREAVLFTLLCDRKAEDLSKTYRFFESRDNLKENDGVFSKLKDRFSKHLWHKVDDLRRQAKDSTNNKDLLWQFIGLHEMEYFEGLTIFFKALQESVSCSFSAQFFNTIRKNIWKDQSGRLCKEDEEMYQEVKGKVTDKWIALLRKQRTQGKIIEDRKVMMQLLSKVLGILCHMKPHCFTGDIVNPLINSTKDDYSEKASSLIRENLCLEDYIAKVDEYVAVEEKQSRLYLLFDEKDIDQMIQEVKNVLFGSYSDSLLHGYKAEDLYRMYIHCSQICGHDKEPIFVEERLKNAFEYNNQDAKSNDKVSRLLQYIIYDCLLAKIFREKLGARLQESLSHLHEKDISGVYMLFPKTYGLDPFVGMFKKRTMEGIMELVKQTNGSTITKESFVWKLSSLRSEYIGQAINCFQHHESSFHKAIEDAFRLAFNDGDLATSVVEILADALCDIILKKADSDEAPCDITRKEAYRDKASNEVSGLLEYISDRDHFANICREKLVGRLQKSPADFNDDKKLSKTCGLFYKTIGRQEPFVGMFKTSLTNEIMKMVKNANKLDRCKKSFARNVSVLRDEYKDRAKRYFQDHASVHETIEDAFKLAFNDGDLATSVVKILVDAWCDIILDKTHGDEANMVSRLLKYISHRDHFANIYREKLVGRLQESFADHNEGLSKTYELFSNIIGGQEPFVDMFKTHLRNEIMEMVKQAKDSPRYKKEPEGSTCFQSFVREVSALHYKYKQQARTCFQDHESFHKTIEDAFRFAFNDGDLATLVVVEILADDVGDIILKKADSDEAIINEVSGLLVYISDRDHFAYICRAKLNRGLQESFADLPDEDLSEMYGRFTKFIDGQEPFVGMFETCLTNKIKEMVKQQAEDSARYKKDLAWKITELHDKCEERVTGCFGVHHETFHKALAKVFEDICNKDVSGTSTAELLANFCDKILKKDFSKTLSDDEIIVIKDEKLDKVVRLLPYFKTNNRDLFAEFCRKNLADRLLSKQSADYKLERSFLTKLEPQYGRRLITSKMNDMISNITGARDSQTKFQEFITVNPELNSGIDFTFTVLNKWSWPSYKTFGIKLPAEMVNCQRVCEEYYQKQNNQKKPRKLSWPYSLGNCTIRATVGTKTFTLNVNPIQVAVLYLFNKSDILSCSEIAKELNVTVDAIKPFLQSLSCGEYKILNLNKKGATATISAEDEFTFNSDFDVKKKTIKIPLPPDVRIMKKRKTEDMGYAIEALIVRITKQRKVTSHKELVSECVRQLQFKPDEEVIKKRIGSLIEREYIKRAKDDENTYHYVQ